MKTLFHNAQFHTMEDETSCTDALLVEDGIILAVGQEAKDLVGDDGSHLRSAESLRKVDLGGAHAYPALIDAHLHMLDAIGLIGNSLHLTSFTQDGVEPHTLEGIAEEIQRFAAESSPDDLLICTGYIAMAMDEGRLPNRFELDQWAGGRRIWVMNMDLHSSSCSTALLTQVGLEDVAPDGILEGPNHDGNIGLLTGALADSIGPRQLGAGIAEFCNQCAAYGIGTVCALEGKDDIPRDSLTELFVWLAQRMPIDVRLFPQYMDDAKLARVKDAMATPRVGGCMKWELDGSIGSNTAAFARPFLGGQQGSLYFTDQEVVREVCKREAQGYMVSAHAIGELAIDQLLDAFDAALEEDPSLDLTRMRIDHLEFPSPQAVERVCRMRPSVTVQPGYAWVDKRFLHGYERRLDQGYINQQVPLRTLMDAGVCLCGSSDAPVQSIDPFLQMRGMREFYLPEQSLTGYEALKTYTVNGGLMLGEAKGLLKPGYEASFFTCGEDLFTCEPVALDGLRAKRTFLHGREYRPLPRSASTLAKLALSRPHKI